MTLFSIYVFIAIITAFTAGFFVGKRRNQQNAMRFVDLKVAKEVGEKGRKTIEQRIERRKARIMERARAEGKITNDDVEDLFCISDSTARNYLGELEEAGKLTKHGSVGRGVYYTPTS